MTFEDRKKVTLDKKDRSKKGSVDDAIIPLLDIINKQKDLYTTSSCAGRISLISLTESRKKHESEWLHVTHDFANSDEVWESLTDTPETDVWFRMESAIIHICCKTMESALEMLECAKTTGFKHSGILSIANRIIVEIFGSEKLDTIVAKNGKVLINKEYMDVLVNEANDKLSQTRKKIDVLKEKLKKK